MKWLVFVTLTACLYTVLQFATSRRRMVQARLEWAAIKDQPKTTTKVAKNPFWRKIAQRVALHSFRTLSNKGIEKIQNRLQQAGSPGQLSVAEWIGLRLMFTAIGVVLGLLFLWLSHFRLPGFGMLLALLLLGWIGPDFWLSRQITSRRTKLLHELPNVLDLLTVSVEAGLGFDQAMGRVAEKLKGELGLELERVLREIQLGSARVPALQRFATRTGVDAVRTFVTAVVQAEKLGVGMAQVLRVQSAEVRRKRKMDAQERAMKAPVKMLFPLVAFVFPALFVIILGPAVIHMLQYFTG